VIVNDFDIVCVAVCEAKADPPLVVHADAELAAAIAFQA